MARPGHQRQYQRRMKRSHAMRGDFLSPRPLLRLLAVEIGLGERGVVAVTTALFNFLGPPFLAFLEMAGSRPDRPLRTPGLLLQPAISLGDLRQLWHPTSHLHWRDHAMIRQSLHSPPHWSPQFLDQH